MQRYELTFYPEGEMIPHRQGEYIRYADHEQAVVKAREALEESLALNINWAAVAEPDILEHLSEYIAVIKQAREALAALTPADSGK